MNTPKHPVQNTASCALLIGLIKLLIDQQEEVVLLSIAPMLKIQQK